MWYNSIVGIDKHFAVVTHIAAGSHGGRREHETLRGGPILSVGQERVGFCCFCIVASFQPHRAVGFGTGHHPQQRRGRAHRRVGGDVDRGVDSSYNGGGLVLLALSLS